MRDFFRTEGGLRVASVHSGETSDPRTSSLQGLARGELDVLFCVDMFNEGVDVPSIDTVLMLRPTDSKVVWLQQLGRGLRRSEGKQHLSVIDYIGNHRVFVNKPEALLQALGVMTATQREVVQALRQEKYRPNLPPGCEVTYDLECIDLLEKLFPQGKGAARIQQWYEEFREYNDRRPTALEAYQSTFNLGVVRKEYGSWFGFVRAMGDLGADEVHVCKADSALLNLVETTKLTHSYKLLVLQAMLHRGCLPGSLTIPDLAGAFSTLAARSSRLRRDVSTDLSDEDAIEGLLVKYPCPLLVADPAADGAPLFRLTDGVFGTTEAVKSPADSALPALVAELVEWRMAEYLDRPGDAPVFRVIQASGGNPIVKIDRKRNDLPEGWAEVAMGGRPYQVKFAKEFVNVAREPGSEQNTLPAILREWFGPGAGQQGRSFEVRHIKHADGSIHWEPATAGASNTEAQTSVPVSTPKLIEPDLLRKLGEMVSGILLEHPIEWSSQSSVEATIEREGDAVSSWYHTEDGRSRVECRFANETLWLSHGGAVSDHEAKHRQTSAGDLRGRQAASGFSCQPVVDDCRGRQAPATRAAVAARLLTKTVDCRVPPSAIALLARCWP